MKGPCLDDKIKGANACKEGIATKKLKDMLDLARGQGPDSRAGGHLVHLYAWIKRYAWALGRIFFYALIAAFIGAIVGALDALFGLGLIALNHFRDTHPLYLLPFLGLAGCLIMLVYLRYGGKAQKGMALVFAVGYREDERIPLRMIPLTIGATWLTHLFGGSAGREGVAVQIGATVANSFSYLLPIKLNPRVVILAGMAAGFGGLFGTPMAGTFFALEVLVVGSIFYDALVPALVAAWTAAFTSRALGLESFNLGQLEMLDIDLQLLLRLIAVGLAFGLVGRMFSLGLFKCRILFASWIPHPVRRIFIIGTILGIIFLALDFGRYSGLSNGLFYGALNGGEIYWWDWALKLILTVITLAAGFQGGELAPCLVIGASLGVVLGQALGISPALIAACGACAVFGAATRTFLAPIFMGVELFGPQVLPYFFIVCMTAHVVAGQASIYASQKDLLDILVCPRSDLDKRLLGKEE